MTSSSYYDASEHDYRRWLSKQHAMARYEWTYRVEKFGLEGSWQLLLTWVFLLVARFFCIMFWENFFATLLSAIVFLFAGFHYDQFAVGETVLLVLIGLFFLLPLFGFIAVEFLLEMTRIRNAKSEAIEKTFERLASIMEDILKPLQFFSPIILFAIVAGFLIMRR